MADQLPIISGTRAINATATASTSLIGRGLSAIQRKETGIALSELDVRYRQARNIYNRITSYGVEHYFYADEQFGSAELKQMADIFIVFKQLSDQGYGKAYFPIALMYWGGQGISKNIEKKAYYSCKAFDWCFANQA